MLLSIFQFSRSKRHVTVESNISLVFLYTRLNLEEKESIVLVPTGTLVRFNNFEHLSKYSWNVILHFNFCSRLESRTVTLECGVQQFLYRYLLSIGRYIGTIYIVSSYAKCIVTPKLLEDGRYYSVLVDFSAMFYHLQFLAVTN